MPLWTLTELTAQISLTPAKPSDFWPVSISGWITLISSSVALVVVVWRANNKPVLDRLASIEKKFEMEVRQIEKRLDEQEAQREKAERRFVEQVDYRLNGMGARVEELRTDQNRSEAAIGEQANKMIESQADRKSIDRRVTEIRTEVSTLISQLPALEIRMNKTMTEQTHTILKEVAILIQNINR